MKIKSLQMPINNYFRFIFQSGLGSKLNFPETSLLLGDAFAVNLSQLSEDIEQEKTDIDITALRNEIESFMTRAPQDSDINMESNIDYYEKDFFGRSSVKKWLSNIEPAISTFEALNQALIKQKHILCVFPMGNKKELGNYSIIPFEEQDEVTVRGQKIPYYKININEAKSALGDRFKDTSKKWNRIAGENISSRVFPQAIIFPETTIKAYKSYFDYYTNQGVSAADQDLYKKGLLKYGSINESYHTYFANNVYPPGVDRKELNKHILQNLPPAVKNLYDTDTERQKKITLSTVDELGSDIESTKQILENFLKNINNRSVTHKDFFLIQGELRQLSLLMFGESNIQNYQFRVDIMNKEFWEDDEIKNKFEQTTKKSLETTTNAEKQNFVFNNCLNDKIFLANVISKIEDIETTYLIPLENSIKNFAPPTKD